MTTKAATSEILVSTYIVRKVGIEDRIALVEEQAKEPFISPGNRLQQAPDD